MRIPAPEELPIQEREEWREFYRNLPQKPMPQPPPKRIQQTQLFRFRLLFRKQGDYRFLSHLDLIKSFSQAMRRACIPVAYTLGFNPHPRFSLSPPLPVGHESEGEYMEVFLYQKPAANELQQKLNRELPQELHFTFSRPLFPSEPSAHKCARAVGYQIEIPCKRLPKWFNQSAEAYLQQIQQAREQAEDAPCFANLRKLSPTVFDGSALFPMLLLLDKSGPVNPVKDFARILQLSDDAARRVRCLRLGFFTDIDGRQPLS